eukprot:8043149-Pyramimonas_sp.AAC.1
MRHAIEDPADKMRQRPRIKAEARCISGDAWNKPRVHRGHSRGRRQMSRFPAGGERRGEVARERG